MKTNNIFKVLGVLILGIFILGFVNAVAPCWDLITCNNTEITSGSMISPDYTKTEDLKEEYCEITGINNEIYREFEIEIIQGQFEGGVKTIRIFVDDQFIGISDKINFVLSKATSPTYVLCHEIKASSLSTENPVRLGTKRFWTASYDQQWFKQNAGMAEYEGYENLKNWNQNQTYNNSDRNMLYTNNDVNLTSVDIGFTVEDANFVKTYENYPATMSGNWLIFTIAVFFLIIGLLIAFQSVIIYTKRR